MKYKVTFLLLAIYLTGTLHAAQTAGDIIRLRQKQKAKTSGDIIKLRKAKQSRPTVMTPNMNAYLNVSGGIAFAGESSLDAGYAVTIAIGTDFDEVPARMELEYGYQQNELNDNAAKPANGDETQQTVMGNLYYDFENSAELTPYLFGGLGMALVEGKTSDTVFAYQTGAGLGYLLSEKMTLDLKYRYLGVQDTGVDSHNITIGIRYGF